MEHLLREIDLQEKTAECETCGKRTWIRQFYDHHGELFWRCYFKPWPIYEGRRTVRVVKNRNGDPPVVIPLRVIFRFFVKQKGMCGACGVELTRRANIDHCHETKRPCGLLCNNCNSSAGLLGDDYRRAEKLAEYLKRTRN